MSAPTAKIITTKKEEKMSFIEIQKELEAIVKAETPDRLDLVYAKLWGIAVAHLTEEQISAMLRNRKKAN
jgi:hypothetical protein